MYLGEYIYMYIFWYSIYGHLTGENAELQWMEWGIQFLDQLIQQTRGRKGFSQKGVANKDEGIQLLLGTNQKGWSCVC
jgi:uncharacterized protein (DUF486 family)